jgi:hypothetical protein
MMRHIYTPSLNIRSDPYTHVIKTNLLGEAYIKANPFGDIRLIEQWTTFFKDMGSADIYNTISDITVGKIQPDQNGFFRIPITVQFETQDRRGFLLLANKLSMTSYTENISLINEFMYYLRNTIATDKKDIIATAMS